jgi:hypothetical protein
MSALPPTRTFDSAIVKSAKYQKRASRLVSMGVLSHGCRAMNYTLV